MALGDNSRWRFVVTDMSGGTSSPGCGAVLNTTGKQYSHHLNAGRTAQFTVDITNPVANYILTNRAMCKVYRKTKVSNTWQLLLVGDIISVDESGQGDMGLMTCVVADPFWRIQRRVLGTGTDALGRGTGYTDGSAGSTVDVSNLILHIIQTLQGTYNMGLIQGTVNLCGTTSYLGPLYMQNPGDIIQQLLAILGGPNMRINPLEPYNLMPNTIIGSVDIVPAIGTNRPNTFFEYGCGQRNVATYDRILTLDGLANSIISVPQGFPDVVASGDGVLYSSDSSSMSAIGLYQDIIQDDLTTQALRQLLASANLAVRKNARQQITFTPTVNCTLDYNVDYAVGDTVGARAFVSGTYRYNGTVRIYGVDISVDDNDTETPALTLIPS